MYNENHGSTTKQVQNLIDKEKEFKMEKLIYTIQSSREQVTNVQHKIATRTRKSKFEQKGLEAILGNDGDTHHTVESLSQEAKKVKETGKKRYFIITREHYPSGYVPTNERVETEVKVKGRPRNYEPTKVEKFLAEIIDGEVVIVHKEATESKYKKTKEAEQVTEQSEEITE